MNGLKQSGWVGVDLDGVLAEYWGWEGPEHIGPPITPVLHAVWELVASGREVRIFTARACIPSQIPPIKAWLDSHKLGGLEVTCVKDIGMVELWDDRCVQFMPNRGVRVEDCLSADYRDELDSARSGSVIDTYSADYIRSHNERGGR